MQLDVQGLQASLVPSGRKGCQETLELQVLKELTVFLALTDRLVYQD